MKLPCESTAITTFLRNDFMLGVYVVVSQPTLRMEHDK